MYLENYYCVYVHLCRNDVAFSLKLRRHILKNCLCPPPSEVFEILSFLDEATNLHLEKHHEEAKKLIALANNDKVREWTESLWGAKSPYVKPIKVDDPLPHLSKDEKIPVRMPNSEMKEMIHKRDGFHCRVCGVPLIRKEVRTYFDKFYPELKIWGNKNILQHAGFQAVWLQYDHVIPHARGGDNSVENIILTCAPCNYSRMNYTFEEIGLEDPRLRKPVKSDWDGLERIFK